MVLVHLKYQVLTAKTGSSEEGKAKDRVMKTEWCDHQKVQEELIKWLILVLNFDVCWFLFSFHVLTYSLYNDKIMVYTLRNCFSFSFWIYTVIVSWRGDE